MNGKELLSNIVDCVESGKIKESSPYPREMIGRLGADELTQNALDKGLLPHAVPNQDLIAGMQRMDVMFRGNRVFGPQILMFAKPMSTVLAYLKPYFRSESIMQKGILIIGKRVMIGGAPVTDGFRSKINADFYSADPQGAVEKLKSISI